jgi:hypothetical protein
VDPSSVCDGMNMKLSKKIMLVEMQNFAVKENIPNYHKSFAIQNTRHAVVRIKVYSTK